MRSLLLLAAFDVLLGGSAFARDVYANPGVPLHRSSDEAFRAEKMDSAKGANGIFCASKYIGAAVGRNGIRAAYESIDCEE